MKRTTASSSYCVHAGMLIENIKIWLVVKPLQFFYGRKRLDDKLDAMRNLPENSIGYDLAIMLDLHNLRLIPGFRNHDLNHLVLGYGMEWDDELCMQAYQVGNGYREWQCFVFLSSAIIVPTLWPMLWAHFQMGRASVSINELDFETCMMEQTVVVRERFKQCKTNSLKAGLAYAG